MVEYKSLVRKISISPDGKTKQKDYLKKGRLAIVDQGQNIIGGYTDDLKKTVNCELPVIVFGDHTRAVKFIQFPFGAGADGIKILQPREIVLPRYLYYGTMYIVLKMPNRGYARHYQYIEKEDLPVPSLSEQERIVAKIEELFSQLDAGVETLKKIKAQLAIYRQAVLKEAFEGNDSAEVLAENVVLKKKYSFTIGPFGSDLKVSDYTISGIPLVFVRDIRNRFSSNEHKYVSIEKGEQLKAHQVFQGNLLITKMGDPPGDCCIYPFEYPAVITADCIKMEIDRTIILPLYAMYYIQSGYGKEPIKAITQGVAPKKVSLARFKKFRFKIRSLSDQRRIVESIESRFSVCDNIEQTVDSSLQQADALRQSILKDAFEGRL